MTFSKQWNTQYKNKFQLNNWPFTDLVSYTIRHSNINKNKIKILELGCGSGNNIPFFLSYNSEYFGIDGSISIISKLKKKYPKIKNNLIACDFTQQIPIEKKFDLIIDRGSLTHNSTKDIQYSLDLIHKKLNFHGKFIGIDWFSTNHFEYKNGKVSTDHLTKNKYKNGRFKKIGNVHFSNKKHLQKLFSKFKIEVLDEKIITDKLSLKCEKLAWWNIVVKKITQDNNKVILGQY